MDWNENSCEKAMIENGGDQIRHTLKHKKPDRMLFDSGKEFTAK